MTGVTVVADGTVVTDDTDAASAVVPGVGPTGRYRGERTTVRLGGVTARGDAADEPPRYAPEWLRLREPADAAARAHDLLDPLRIRLA
ncbi:trans-aconitate methyltransferase, partial [Streptomyces coelicoflavus]|nr:trans-aconitate methyltransferase [Streptomyces coelicoflavus]